MTLLVAVQAGLSVPMVVFIGAASLFDKGDLLDARNDHGAGARGAGRRRRGAVDGNPWLVPFALAPLLLVQRSLSGARARGGGARRPEDGPLQRAPLQHGARGRIRARAALRAAARGADGRPRPSARDQQQLRAPRRRRRARGDGRGASARAARVRRALALRRRGVRDPPSRDEAARRRRDRRADPRARRPRFEISSRRRASPIHSTISVGVAGVPERTQTTAPSSSTRRTWPSTARSSRGETASCSAGRSHDERRCVDPSATRAPASLVATAGPLGLQRRRAVGALRARSSSRGRGHPRRRRGDGSRHQPGPARHDGPRRRRRDSSRCSPTPRGAQHRSAPSGLLAGAALFGPRIALPTAVVACVRASGAGHACPSYRLGLRHRHADPRSPRGGAASSRSRAAGSSPDAGADRRGAHRRRRLLRRHRGRPGRWRSPRTTAGTRVWAAIRASPRLDCCSRTQLRACSPA